MKSLKNLLLGIDIAESTGDTALDISSVVFDSRMANESCLFVAIKGSNQDGNMYINDAVKNGARAVIYEGEYKERTEGVIYIKVENSRKALALVAQNFFDNPSLKLKIVGVTGTNGKTTTATLLYKLFRSFGYHVALISTVENKIDDEVFPTDHTTPDPLILASFLNLAVSRGCTYAFMECSSHAIDQDRIDGMHFQGAIFTNLTLDHLDYHKTIEEYAKAKKRFFDMLGSDAFAVANADDSQASYMLEGTKASKHFISLHDMGDFNASILENSLKGLKLNIKGGVLETNLIGEFNAYNILGIYASAILLGEDEKRVSDGLKNLTAPAGRLEFIESKNGIYGVVDYAHTPDALENVLKTLNGTKAKDSNVITVVGCGGDRDKTKRPIMGGIATKLSGFTIFTSDNPRSENPETILDDIVAGASGGAYEVVVDRAEAIKRACAHSKQGDIVLVAGKGHETYQIFKDKTVHFSDLEEIQKYF